MVSEYVIYETKNETIHLVTSHCLRIGLFLHVGEESEINPPRYLLYCRLAGLFSTMRNDSCQVSMITTGTNCLICSPTHSGWGPAWCVSYKDRKLDWKEIYLCKYKYPSRSEIEPAIAGVCERLHSMRTTTPVRVYYMFLCLKIY